LCCAQLLLPPAAERRLPYRFARPLPLGIIRIEAGQEHCSMLVNDIELLKQRVDAVLVRSELGCLRSKVHEGSIATR
jgi:hypothetical protein